MVADSLELESVDKVSSNNPARKPRNREVSSRYKSGLSSARRFPSPNIGRSGDGAGAEAPPKRALSAERKRDLDEGSDPALRPNGAGKIRAGTPERKRRQNIDQVENARPLENVGFSTQKSGKPMSRSMDLSMGRVSGIGVKGNRCLAPVRSFNLLVGKPEEPRRSSSTAHEKAGEANKDDTGYVRCSPDVPPEKAGEDKDGTSFVARVPPKVKAIQRDDITKYLRSSYEDSKDAPQKGDEAKGKVPGANEPGKALVPKKLKDDSRCVRSSVDEVSSDADNLASESGDGDDNASVSSGASAAEPRLKTSSKPVRGTIVPARFWQDLNNRIRRLSDVNQLRSSMPEGGESLAGSRTVRRVVKGSSAPSSGASSPATTAAAGNTNTPWIYSPVRAPPAPPPPLSPVKPSSPSRPSPTRSRGPGARPGSVACMLNFGVDAARSRKAATSQQDEAQYLRILHNRWLQWRLVNARAESALSSQQATAERLLYSTSTQISDLQSRVADKRIQLQKARLDSKVHSSIALHGECLEEWAGLEEEHSSSLSGAVKALEAGTLKVPVIGGAKIDVGSLRNALSSAADSMAPLDSTTRALLPNAQRTSEVVSQLAEVSSQGRLLLQECGELLDRIAALEIEERSLRSYFLQLGKEKHRRGCEE